MTSQDGIRAGAPNTFFFTPYTVKQYDPTEPVECARRPLWPLSHRRQHVGTKYDVRSIYPPDHPLRKQEIDIPSHPPQPSLNDYFLLARVLEKDKYLRTVWEKETGQIQGCDEGEDVELNMDLHSDAPNAALFTVLSLFGVLLSSLVASVAVRGIAWLAGGIWRDAPLWMAYKIRPLALRVRDGAFQVSVRTRRWISARSWMFWMCVVMGLLVVDWGMTRAAEREHIAVVIRRGKVGSVFRVSNS